MNRKDSIETTKKKKINNNKKNQYIIIFAEPICSRHSLHTCHDDGEEPYLGLIVRSRFWILSQNRNNLKNSTYRT